MSLSIVCRILAALLPFFVGEAVAQKADPAAIAKINREVFNALHGTTYVEAKPQFTDGKLWNCYTEFGAIERDWAYKQGDHIRVGGSFSVAKQQGTIAILLKVILHDIDVRVIPAAYVPNPPATAYFIFGNSTTKDAVVSSSPSDIPGAIFVVLRPDNIFKPLLNDFSRGKVMIAFARKKGGTDIVVPIDTRVVETKADGSRVRSMKPHSDFLECMSTLIN
jgi:hypothetical protein